ncbi:MAG: acyltransferase [Nitrospiraceae bacterium]|nr:MAG: acyltransferase [Nitrospiraceae bacterium]
MKEQLREFNYLRTIATISIIGIHASGPWRYTDALDKYGFIWNETMRYAIPLFLIISGFLLFNGNNKDGFSYLEYYRKRFSRIVVPYILWTIFYFVYDNKNNLMELWEFKVRSIVRLIRMLCVGYGHLYFIVIILQMYILFPVLIKLIRRYPKAVLSAAFLMTFYLQTAEYLNLYQIEIFWMFDHRFYQNMFPTWIFYFAFGMYASANIPTITKIASNYRIELFIIWITSLIILLLDSEFSRAFTTSIKPTVLLYAITSFLFFYSISISFHVITNPAGKFADWVSSQSYIIYLSHLFFIREIRMLTNNDNWNSLLGMTALFFLTLISCLLFAYIISLRSVAPWLGGTNIWRSEKQS